MLCCSFSPPSTPHLSFFFLHWFPDSTEMKNTLVRSNKRKARQLCEIFGHRGSEKWTILRSASPLLWMALLIMHTTVQVWGHTHAVIKTLLHLLARVDSNIQLPLLLTHTLSGHTHSTGPACLCRVMWTYAVSCTCSIPALAHAGTHSMHSAAHLPEHKCFLLHFNEEHSGRAGWDSTHSAKIFENMVLFTSLSQLFVLLGPRLSYEKTHFLSSSISSKSTYSALFWGGKGSV